MRLDLFDYELDASLIARSPSPERDGARMLVVARDGTLEDSAVRRLPSRIGAGALLVVNDTRVIPARLLGRKPSGGRVEVLLVERAAADADGARQRWWALVRASKAMRPGTRVLLEGGMTAEVIETPAAKGRPFVVELTSSHGSVADAIRRWGHVPLPPYLQRADEPFDRERYQTVFARAEGAVAAPTAGLHLSERLLAELGERAIRVATVTLHVSLGTFQPVEAEDLDEHEMHAERFEVSGEAAAAVADARARGAPVVAVGTTCVRALESAADPSEPGLVRATGGSTRLLIQPGYRFRVVDQLLTNFHLPRSTLLALVCAFGGRAAVLGAYRHAATSGYRFYSYGDAMLLERAEIAP